MEYVFGTKGGAETLRTKGTTHSDLTGYRQIEQIYSDQTVTDSFHVVCKLRSDEDAEGNCYDWYEIDRHYRTVDRTAPIVERLDSVESGETQRAAQIQMQSQQLAFLEDCILEMADEVYA